MARCELCSQHYPEGTVFCDTCGTPLDADVGQQIPVKISKSAFDTPSLPSSQAAHPVSRQTPLAVGVSAPRALPQKGTSVSDAVSVLGARAGEGPRHEASAGDTPPAATPARVRLRMTNGRTFELAGREVYFLGRRDRTDTEQPQVDFADYNGAASGVSRRHAAIHVRADGVFVEDLESRNETIHNGYRLISRQLYPLSDGDELRLGTILLRVTFD